MLEKPKTEFSTALRNLVDLSVYKILRLRLDQVEAIKTTSVFELNPYSSFNNNVLVLPLIQVGSEFTSLVREGCTKIQLGINLYSRRLDSKPA